MTGMTIDIYREQLLSKIASRLNPKRRGYLLATQIRFNSRLRTSIGRAHLHKNLIELNPRLLNQFPDELLTTVAHELAHIAAPLIFGKDGLGHGEGWKQIMREFGLPPTRTHNLPVTYARRPQPVVAKATCGCTARVHELKPRTFRKMRYGRRKYICLKCKQELKIIKT